MREALGRGVRPVGGAEGIVYVEIGQLGELLIVQIAVAFLWTALLIATFVVGVRQALSTSTGRAGFVCLVLLMTLIFAALENVSRTRGNWRA